MTKRNLPSKMPVTKTCTVWLVSGNEPESIPSSAALRTQTPHICLIHLENYSAITENKQNNWLRMAETPPNSHSSHLQTLAYRGKVRLWNINCSCWSSSKWQGAKESQLMLELGRHRDGVGNPTPGAPAALCTPHPTKGDPEHTGHAHN